MLHHKKILLKWAVLWRCHNHFRNAVDLNGIVITLHVALPSQDLELSEWLYRADLFLAVANSCWLALFLLLLDRLINLQWFTLKRARLLFRRLESEDRRVDRLAWVQLALRLLKTPHRLNTDANSNVNPNNWFVTVGTKDASQRARRFTEKWLCVLFVVWRTDCDLVLYSRVRAPFFLENWSRELFVNIAVKFPVLQF